MSNYKMHLTMSLVMATMAPETAGLLAQINMLLSQDIGIDNVNIVHYKLTLATPEGTTHNVHTQRSTGFTLFDEDARADALSSYPAYVGARHGLA